MAATSQVSALSILFMCFTLLICFGAPVGIAIWAKAKYKKAFSFLPLLGGVLGFFISQIVLRLPVMQYLLPQFDWYRQFAQSSIWLFATVGCFTAGLVEEPARFIVFTIMKRRRQYVDGLSYGIGHGGIEAIWLTGFTFINNIVYSIMINDGSVGQLGGLLPDSALQQIYAIASVQPGSFMIGGVERLLTICVQIALSLVVLKGFQTGHKALYLLFSIVLHGVVNFIPIVLLPMLGVTNPWAIEAVIGLEAVLAVWFIISQARSWSKSQAATLA